MKKIALLIVVLLPVFSYTQIRLTQIEGRLEVHLHNDATSIHPGKESGIQQENGVNKHDTFVGYLSGNKNSSGGDNTIIGSFSGRDNISTYINSFLGRSFGLSNNSGSNNSFFGLNTGRNNKIGHSNIGFGSFSLATSITKNYNVADGDSALYQVVSNLDEFDEFWRASNTSLGHASLKSTNRSGSFNSVALGYPAGRGAVNSVIAGYRAGKGLVSNSLLIGNIVGHARANISNKSMITNAQADTPLLCGEFDNSILQTNGLQRIYRDDARQLEFINSDTGGNKWRISSSNNSWNSGGGKLLIGTSSKGLSIDNENILYFITAFNSPQIFSWV